MAKHTPGPWQSTDQNYVRSGNAYICDANYVQTLGTGADVREANARLIAAAPEMLEALWRCVGGLEYAAEKMPHSNAREALGVVRAAISKAEAR